MKHKANVDKRGRARKPPVEERATGRDRVQCRCAEGIDASFMKVLKTALRDLLGRRKG